MKEFTKANEILLSEIGQDKIMTLATRNEEGVSSRTINVYTHENCFYFVTEVTSNKYKQLALNNNVALSVDAIQISGHTVPLEHPCDESNSKIIEHIEKLLPNQFAQYEPETDKRLIRILPAYASFIILNTGTGYVIDFVKKEALEIHR